MNGFRWDVGELDMYDGKWEMVNGSSKSVIRG